MDTGACDRRVGAGLGLGLRVRLRFCAHWTRCLGVAAAAAVVEEAHHTCTILICFRIETAAAATSRRRSTLINTRYRAGRTRTRMAPKINISLMRTYAAASAAVVAINNTIIRNIRSRLKLGLSSSNTRNNNNSSSRLLPHSSNNRNIDHAGVKVVPRREAGGRSRVHGVYRYLTVNILQRTQPRLRARARASMTPLRQATTTSMHPRVTSHWIAVVRA